MGSPSGGVLMRKRISGSPANRAAGPACPEISRSQGRYGRIEIQPNAIPGDDGQDDLHTPEHPAVRVLLLTNTAAAERRSTTRDRSSAPPRRNYGHSKRPRRTRRLLPKAARLAGFTGHASIMPTGPE